jgi:hypothetical protein
MLDNIKLWWIRLLLWSGLRKPQIFLGFRGQKATLANVQDQTESGWSDILKRLVDDLFWLGWDGRVLQVKEKFGGLRFYINTGSDAIHDRISQAENESYKTCEQCGKPGVPRGGGWIKTLCDEHSDGRPLDENFIEEVS